MATKLLGSLLRLILLLYFVFWFDYICRCLCHCSLVFGTLNSWFEFGFDFDFAWFFKVSGSCFDIDFSFFWEGAESVTVEPSLVGSPLPGEALEVVVFMGVGVLRFYFEWRTKG